jgi:DNA-binding CsgD family transcriptional regulator
MLDKPMNRGIAALSERERQVLRLLLRGHDAKSIARDLGLSVHTVNEHLREARRKTGVSSSRAAARLLAKAEGEGPKSLADKEIGIGPRDANEQHHRRTGEGHRLAWLGGGMLIMSLIIVAAALSSTFRASSAAQPGSAPKIVATNPKQGATIKPGTLLLSVTYDRAMQPGSYSFAGNPQLAPENCAKPEQSKDGRTYSMRCTVSAGRQYEMWFNRAVYKNFKSLEGISADPYRLVFKVSAR